MFEKEEEEEIHFNIDEIKEDKCDSAVTPKKKEEQQLSQIK